MGFVYFVIITLLCLQTALLFFIFIEVEHSIDNQNDIGKKIIQIEKRLFVSKRKGKK